MAGVELCLTPVSVSGTSLDGLVCVGMYHDAHVRALLHALKYENATCMEAPMRALLARWKGLYVGPMPWSGERGIGIQRLPAVPSHVKRRGFDQAELLVEWFRPTLAPGGEVLDALIRLPTSFSQAELDAGPMRGANVKGSFELRPVPLPEAALLVDDVVTTGATMGEAARLLKESGVKRVYGFAFAAGK